MAGKKLTEEHKQKLSISIRETLSNPEIRKRMSLAKIGRKHPRARKVICITSNKIYDTQRDAAIIEEVNKSLLSRKLNREKRPCILNKKEFEYYDLWEK